MNIVELDKNISNFDTLSEEYEQYAIKLSKLEKAMEQADKQVAYLESLFAGE